MSTRKLTNPVSGLLQERGRGSRLSPAAWLALGVGAVILVLVIPPLVVLVSASFHRSAGLQEGPLSLDNYRNIFGQDTLNLIKNSLIYAIGSTGVAVIAGVGLAWLVERTTAPFKGAVYFAAFIGLGVPGIVNVIGWILLFGPNAGMINSLAEQLGLGQPLFDIFSMGGMIMVEGLAWTPVVFLLMATPFKYMDPSLEEAGLMSGANRRQIFWRITIRLAWPSALAALILSIIRTLESFETPALIGIPGGIRVLTTEIYLQVTSGLISDYGEASAYSVILILIVMVLLRLYNRQTAHAERFATVTGKGYRPGLVDLGRWRYLGGFVCLSALVIVLLPLAAMAWTSFLPYAQGVSTGSFGQLTTANYTTAFQDSGIIQVMANTLIVGGLSALLVMLLALLTAWVIIRTRTRGRGILDFLASIPLVIPGVVAGIAILRTYMNFPIPVYGTLFILVIAFVMRYLPYGMRYAVSGILQMHSDLEESAEVSGASLFTRLRRIVLPLCMPALLGGFTFALLNSSSQLAIPLLLSGPDSKVISVSIFDLYQNGQITELAAFSISVTAIIVALSFITYRFGRTQGL